MLTAYVDSPPNLSRAMVRVQNALRQFAPNSVECVSREQDAELVVLHVIGIHDVAKKIEELKSRNQKYAIIQYCLKSSGASIREWLPIWDSAEVVWSYYSLRSELDANSDTACSFYLAPLGIDETFTRLSGHFAPGNKAYGILTSGYAGGSQEAIDVCYEAARFCDKRVFHLGPDPVDVTPFDGASINYGIPDAQLAAAYSLSEYVSGLRWAEGFELPVIEGLVCGARPICFDLPCYRQWFDGIATFVPHDREKLLPAIINALQNPNPVTVYEAEQTKTRFDWRCIVRGFWERV